MSDVMDADTERRLIAVAGCYKEMASDILTDRWQHEVCSGSGSTLVVTDDAAVRRNHGRYNGEGGWLIPPAGTGSKNSYELSDKCWFHRSVQRWT